MKQQDIAAIIIIVVFAGIAAFFISGQFIAPAEKRTAETVSPITPEFAVPDKNVFNEQAVNPTVKIEIAPGENNQPFANDQQ